MCRCISVVYILNNTKSDNGSTVDLVGAISFDTVACVATKKKKKNPFSEKQLSGVQCSMFVSSPRVVCVRVLRVWTEVVVLGDFPKHLSCLFFCYITCVSKAKNELADQNSTEIFLPFVIDLGTDFYLNTLKM